MPNDLYYFYESDLDKGNFSKFYNSLPSSGLKKQFLNSIPKGNICWDSTWVLQGYKGPYPNGESGDSEKLSPSCGLQEVRYWWGVSKHINWIPIAGILVWGASKIAGKITDVSKWCSLYFDSKTGECLSHDKEVAASKLNDIGRQLFDSGKFNEAREYFSNAYTHSNNKANYDIYKDNENKAKTEVDAINLNSQGNNLFSQGKYSEAQSKYQEAYDKSQVSKEYNTYKANRDKAQTEIDAIGLKELGDKEFNAGRYDGAKVKYQQAYDKSSVAANKTTYTTCSNKAKAELDAIGLKELGDKEFNAGRYDGAKVKYQQAYDKSSVAANKTTYTTCSNKTKAELDAIGLKELGDKEFNAGRYDGAKVKYQQAYDKSSVATNKTTYTTCSNKVKAELDAIGLKELGDKEFNAGRYDGAKVKYQQAYDKSSVAANKTTYTACSNKAKAELDAIGLKELGDKEFNAGRYDGAKVKYQQAYDKSSVATNKTTYTTCSNKVKAELDAIGLKELGDKEFNAGRYDGAKVKYQQAYDKSSVAANKTTYTACSNKAKAELDAIGLKELGDKEFNAGRYDGAKVKYQQAYDKSSVATNKTTYTTCSNKVKAELDAIGLKELGDKEFNAGRYDGAKVKYQQAYDKSSVAANKTTYTACSNKAKAELDAIGLKELGDKEFNAGRYDGAKVKYQQAYDKSSVAANKTTYTTCSNKTKAELDAIGLKELGDKEFNAGRYDGAKVKYQQAYDKSSVATNKTTYTTCSNKVKAELDAIGLKELGDKEFNAGRYDGAKVKYQQAYDKSSVAANKTTYTACSNKAKAELDAIGLKELGDKEFNAGRYDGAKVKYQQAYDKSSVATNKTTYTTCSNKVKAELDAIGLKELGDKEFNAGRYDGAKVKYQQAYDKSSVAANKTTYTACSNKAKAELDAIDLNSQGDNLFKQGKYGEAQSKYQEASNKSKVSNQYNKYKANIDKAKYKSVFTDFSLMLTQDITDSELKEFADKLERMIDEGYGSDSEIVSRFHIVCLRIARKEMNSQLESINREDINDLRTAIMNLIETEIKVLKKLNITDPKLEQELESLEEKLNVIDDENEAGNNDVNIELIAIRVKEIDQEIETKVFETLAQERQLEHGGNALALRDPLITPIVETYLMNGMNEILQLRISSIEEENTKQIKLLPSNVTDTEISGINLHDVANQLVCATNENEITVIPLLVTAQNINIGSNINHWVGLISEHSLDGIIVSYLDSENSSLEGLSEYILDVFKVIHPNYKISFREIAVEQQRYNNCGSELIENIVLYITGSRTDQESAIYLHSSLWEQSLILADINTPQDKDMRSTLTTLSKKTTDSACNDRAFVTNYDDVDSSFSECTNLSGSINYDMENL
ncbi:tetratricopeptide repeat protein [Candidatus Tisiphia endosymbiont of Ditula angustiorana]|uniref:tetratricopeptide repeat protein n=1 Tax=Candidatus Tisiphia endosymbiont of Ditula angustiorana TaxID=3066272 RepID=UPI00312CB53A